MEKINEEKLIEREWEKDETLKDVGLIQYRKTINKFHYILMYRGLEYNNWFDWNLHIDNPDFQTVGCLEVENFEDIDQVSKIYD